MLTNIKSHLHIVAIVFTVVICVYVIIYQKVQMRSGNMLDDMFFFTTHSRLYTGLTATPQPAISRHWQPIGKNTDIYVYAAYHDDVTRIVKVIAIAKVNKMDNSQCVFKSHDVSKTWVKGQLNIISEHHWVTGQLKILPEHHGQTYKPAFIICHVPGDVEPATVQIVYNGTSQPLKVLYRRPQAYNFTVCVPALFGPYTDVNSIVEMVEADVMFGADMITFYNYSVSPEVDKLLRYYMHKGIVEVLPWNLPEVNIHYNGQLATVHDCILANTNRSKFLVLKDTDELIVPHAHSTWNEMMASLHKHSPKAAVYIFRNSFYDLSWRNITGCSQENPQAVTLNIRSISHIWRQGLFFSSMTRSKVIIRPELVDISGIHQAFTMHKGYIQIAVATNVSYLHHYRIRDGKSNKVKDAHMCTHADELVRTVNDTLTKYKLHV